MQISLVNSSFFRQRMEIDGLASKVTEIDAPLGAIGFQIEVISPSLVSGRFNVSPICCQPFKVLHGGISAMVAEALASIGAHVASGFRRVAGVQLSINHHRPASLGDDVLAEALPISIGKTIQGPLLASSRVTLVTNLPVPEEARGAADKLRKHAKL
ncbi:unnamed protein product [Spirodela intermedia]|uniref:Thioesterase domain-containing protein n=1 Tax=Spirodela intermedia TaxID=51605 RepID=A0A7I8JC27_SPIIN|nr:unnamed protein product [Spirodela intermedia]CAA6667531.1 unnamed protein product [Spirodela intermedia]